MVFLHTIQYSFCQILLLISASASQNRGCASAHVDKTIVQFRSVVNQSPYIVFGQMLPKYWT